MDHRFPADAQREASGLAGLRLQDDAGDVKVLFDPEGETAVRDAYRGQDPALLPINAQPLDISVAEKSDFGRGPQPEILLGLQDESRCGLCARLLEKEVPLEIEAVINRQITEGEDDGGRDRPLISRHHFAPR